MRDVDLQGLLPTRQRPEAGHNPVQVDAAEQAFPEPCRLPRRHCRLDQWRDNVDHAGQHPHRPAGLDGCVTVIGRPTPLAGRRGLPGHGGIKPDRQRAPALERFITCGPVPGLAGGGCRSAHAAQLPRRVHKMTPSCDLCDRALWPPNDFPSFVLPRPYTLNSIV